MTQTADTSALTRLQLYSSILYGAFLWFCAAMLIQVIGASITSNKVALIATYILVIPGTVPALLLGKAMMKLEKRQVPVSVMVITTTALLLDGLAVNFAAGLYNSDPMAVLTGAALILWGAGVGLVLGLVMGRD